jgi:apolipoprotein N-acyltransferase
MDRNMAKEVLIAVVCLTLPALAMAFLPFLGLPWMAAGWAMFRPLTPHIDIADELAVIFWYWVAYYTVTCLVVWLVVRWVRRRLRRRAGNA